MNLKKKIFSLKEIEYIAKNIRTAKKKIILCHGVFDLLHIGHIRYFEEAKKNSNILIVSVTCDKYVNKGPNRPIFNEKLRAESIASLEVVDYVVINNKPTAENIISIIKPDIYFKGSDYKDIKKDTSKNILKEIRAVKKVKSIIKYSNTELFSSSKLINRNFGIFNKKQRKFLDTILQKFSYAKIESIIEKITKIKVLVIGETIIDQYIFCDVLGKSGKEPHLVISDNKMQNYLGGAAAIANHLSSFCSSIKYLSYIGYHKEFDFFIRENLNKNIKAEFVLKKNSPTILKKRYIDEISRNKLLGVYSINNDLLNKQEEKKFNRLIDEEIKKNDVIIVADYGHGLISQKAANKILNCGKFISLNAQVNASNYGFHSLKKYNIIENLLINENELRHEIRDKSSALDILAKSIMKEFKIKNLIITRGREGAVMFNKKYFSTSCPSFTSNIIDKVGAGDAMFAITSLCLKLKLPPELTLYLGCLAGAFSVENIGNSKSLNKNDFLRNIEFALK